MKNKNYLTIFLCLCAFAASCQQVRQTANDVEELTSSESPVIKPTKNELEAVKTPCDDAANQQEAENCSRVEFEKSEAEMNALYQKILADFNKFAEKAQSQDKVLVENYKRSAENLQGVQKAWLAYREAQCKAETEIDPNNSNDAFIGFSCRQRMTEDRIENLKLIYENR